MSRLYEEMSKLHEEIFEKPQMNVGKFFVDEADMYGSVVYKPKGNDLLDEKQSEELAKKLIEHISKSGYEIKNQGDVSMWVNIPNLGIAIVEVIDGGVDIGVRSYTGELNTLNIKKIKEYAKFLSKVEEVLEKE